MESILEHYKARSLALSLSHTHTLPVSLAPLLLQPASSTGNGVDSRDRRLSRARVTMSGMCVGHIKSNCLQIADRGSGRDGRDNQGVVTTFSARHVKLLLADTSSRSFTKYAHKMSPRTGQKQTEDGEGGGLEVRREGQEMVAKVAVNWH